MDTNEIFELLERFDKSTLSEIIISQGDLRVTLRKAAASVELPAGLPASPSASAHHSIADYPLTFAGQRQAHQDLQEDGEAITSPIVGTFYRAASPDSPPFVEPGRTVIKGQTLCIIEAMKVMNELQAEFDCEITDVLVENGIMVEFGTPLFRVKR